MENFEIIAKPVLPCGPSPTPCLYIQVWSSSQVMGNKTENWQLKMKMSLLNQKREEQKTDVGSAKKKIQQSEKKFIALLLK